MSAILSVVALKILDANGASAKLLQDSSRPSRGDNSFKAGAELFERLREGLPKPLHDCLPAPSQEAFNEAVELLAHDDRFASLWQDVGTLGFVYQIWGHTFRDVALDAVQTPNKELSNETLISFTQVYTPPWVIKYLLDNTLVALLEGEDSATSNGKTDLRTIRLLDPACGAGHFLLAAFDALQERYARLGIEARDSIPLILKENIYGADIDQLGLTVCALSLLLKAVITSPTDSKISINLLLTDAHPSAATPLALGSIDRLWLDESNHFLSTSFDVVVTNPPYIGRRLLSRALKEALTKEFPLSKSDLNTAFIEGSLRFLKEGGYFGAITQASLLSLPSYLDFRKQLEREVDVLAAKPCGTGVFPLLSGEKADSLLLVLRKNTEEKLVRKPFAFNKAERLAPVLDHATAIKLAQLADIRQGLATTDNRRFVRYRWEVDQDSIGKDWMPYVKGAGSERWAASNHHVVRWKNDGEEIKQAVAEAYPYLQGKTAWVVKNEQFYFKEGLCFSFINKTRLAVRELPPGSIFDVASSAIFAQAGEQDFLFGYLNSSIASAFANSINPTINLQVGDLKRIPVPALSTEAKERIAALARACVTKKHRLLQLFDWPQSIQGANRQDYLKAKFSDMTSAFESISNALKSDESELDEFVFKETAKAFAFNQSLSSELAPSIDDTKQPTDQLQSALAARFLHGLVGQLITRDGEENPQIIESGFFARENGNRLDQFGCAEEINKLEFAFGTTLPRYFDKRGVIDLARGFRGPSRYVSLKMPASNATLVLSAKALKTFALTERISLQPLLLTPNANGSPPEFDRSVATQECRSILQSALKGLNKLENWCTKDLITQLELVLSANVSR